MKAKLNSLLNRESVNALIALMDIKGIDTLTKIKLVQLRKKLVEHESDIRSAKLDGAQLEEALSQEVTFDIGKIPASKIASEVSANLLFTLSAMDLVDDNA